MRDGICPHCGQYGGHAVGVCSKLLAPPSPVAAQPAREIAAVDLSHHRQQAAGGRRTASGDKTVSRVLPPGATRCGAYRPPAPGGPRSRSIKKLAALYQPTQPPCI